MFGLPYLSNIFVKKKKNTILTVRNNRFP